jgi:hypothetical protein
MELMFDDRDSRFPDGIIPLSDSYVELKLYTSRAIAAPSSVGNKMVEFMVNGEWGTPQPWYDLTRALSGWTYVQRFNTGGPVDAIRLSVDPGANAMGYWKITMNCGVCEVRVHRLGLAVALDPPLGLSFSRSPSHSHATSSRSSSLPRSLTTSLRRLMQVTILEDPRGEYGTRHPVFNPWATLWEPYWLGWEESQPRVWPWKWQMVAPHNNTYWYDDVTCVDNAAPTMPALALPRALGGSWEVSLSAVTSLAVWGRSHWGTKYAAFLIDDEWTAPMAFFSWDSAGWNHTKRFTLTGKPDAVMLINDGNQWSYWRATLDTGYGPVVLTTLQGARIEDPNGRWGTNNPIWQNTWWGRKSANVGNWSAYWIGRPTTWQGKYSAPSTNVTLLYDDRDLMAAKMDVPALNMTYCQLSVTTSRALWARSPWGT